MSETRQKIIELIEPYMDKTLSDGCLFILMWRLHKARESDIINLEDGEVEDTELDYIMEVAINYYNPEILWHYDITAVLKYISHNWYAIEDISIINEEIIIYNKFDFDEMYKFKNKPLHLYSEQEELQLLNLLNKLK